MFHLRSTLPAAIVLLTVALPASAGRKAREAAAVSDVQARAAAGDAAAQFELGTRLDNGVGVERDLAQAAEWYRKAAEQGHADAQNSIASLHYSGEGVAQDDATAAAWFTKAADQGHAVARSTLGYLYEKGRGVPMDLAKARGLYSQSAEAGCVDGMLNLGVMICSGVGAPADLVDGYAWIHLASALTVMEKDMHRKWTIRAAQDHFAKELTIEQRAAAEKLSKQRSRELAARAGK